MDGIQKRTGPRGISYRVRVDCPPDPVTGKRQRRSATFRTKKEAETARARWLTEIEQGTAVERSKMTLAAYLAHWLDTYGKPNLRTSTYTSYEMTIRLHITPALGDTPLQKLTPGQLQDFYSAKLAGGRADGRPGGLSSRTVRLCHSILREALKHALQLQIVARNVADATKPPKATRPPVRVWDETQVLRFLRLAANDHYATVWLITLMTGLRRGEVLGLRWEDVDLEPGILHIRQSLVEIRGRLYVEQPKTASGRRAVDLDPVCVRALRDHQAQQAERRIQLGAAWRDSGLVFTTREGGPITPRNLDRRYKELIQQAELPPIPFHALRHTHASLLLQQTKDVKMVSERLGHASIQITLDTYAHVLPGIQRRGVEELGRRLFGDS